MKKLLMAGAAAGLCLAAALPAAAQSIDYGSLEGVFNEPVTTSATGSPQRSTEAPADMQIISADEIRRSGETTLPGILQRVAGIDVLNHSAGQSDINVRGYDQMSSPRLLVLVNGRQVYLDHYGVTVWQTLPVQLDEIRQIEVVKGPNSALFGFNAVSGVVNIITYNPKFDDRNAATVRVGTHGLRDVSLVSTFKLGEAVSLRVSGGGVQRDEWATTGALPLASQLHDPARAAAAFDGIAQLSPNVELRLEGAWTNSQQDSLIGTNYSVAKMTTGSGKATLTADTAYGQIQAQAYQNQLKAKYNLSGAVRWENTVTVASVQDLFKVGARNTFRVGVEYRHNTLNTAPLVGGDVSYDVWSGSGMWNWAASDKVAVTTAVRVDSLKLKRTGTFPPAIPLANNSYWNRTITKPSANLTLAWRPTAEDSVRLSYGLGVQTPSLIELGGLQLAYVPFPGMTIDIMGNPNLKPSVVANYEAAYDHSFTAAKIGVRLFHQDWTDIKGGIGLGGLDILPTVTTNGAITNINTGDSKMTGVELSASGSATAALSWHVDYTYTDVKDSPLTGVNTVGRQVAFQSTTPKGRGNVGLDWVSGAWEADANLHYVGKYQWYDLSTGVLAPVDAYASLSARVGYRFGNGITFGVSGQNLLNERQKQTRGLEAERTVLLTVSKSW